MTPESKDLMDGLLTVLGPAGLGGAGIALFAWLKAKAEKPPPAPPPDKPTVGQAGMAQIGGMVMAQQTAEEIIEALQAIAASHNRCSNTREIEMAARKVQWEQYQAFKKKQDEEHRDHEIRLSREAHDQYIKLADVLGVLSRRIEQMPSCNN